MNKSKPSNKKPLSPQAVQVILRATDRLAEKAVARSNAMAIKQGTPKERHVAKGSRPIQASLADLPKGSVIKEIRAPKSTSSID